MNLILLKCVLMCCLTISVSAQPTPTDSCIQYNTNYSVCTKCLQGLYLQYFFCIPCNPLCACSSTNYCQSCLTVIIQNRYFGSYPIEGVCRLCNTTLPFCLECQYVVGLQCKKCMMGRYLVQGMCSNVTCAFNCQFCSTPTRCEVCLPGYYLNSSMQCTPSDCVNNCTVCQDANNCKVCDVQFVQVNGTCQPCIQFCAICTNTTLCQVCLPSYIPVNGTCQSSNISNCIAYTGGVESPTCMVCQPGYYNAQGSCNQCSGCLLCTQAFLCQTPCLQGYYPFNYACLQFQNKFAFVSIGLLILLVMFFLDQL